MRAALNLLTLIAVLASCTWMAAYAVPILFRHGSSSAFNAACILSVAVIALWGCAVYLLFGGRK